jgi:hypothetical protein
MAARPVTRRSTIADAPSVRRPARPCAISPARPRSPSVGRPAAYDFIFRVEDAGSTEDPPADRRWLTDAQASLPQALRASVGRLFEVRLCISSFIVDRPQVRPRAFVDELEAAGPGHLPLDAERSHP